MIRLSMITIDTADPRALAQWWAERLAGEVESNSTESFCTVRVPELPVTLGFQLVADPAPGKNRTHLDLDRSIGTERDALVAEWVAAGATHLAQHGHPGASWDVFAEPAGNEFCIGDPH